MIVFGKAYISDGTAYPTLEKAMVAELALILGSEPGGIPNPNTVAQALVDKRKGIVEVLTTTTNSRPAARKPRTKGKIVTPAIVPATAG